MENIKSKQESRSQLFEEIILKSWWVILFFLLSTFAYDQTARHKTSEEKRLQDKLLQLKNEKVKALEKLEDLKFQINSQEDEAFIELTLMRRLGLVPEGQTKVHFIIQ